MYLHKAIEQILRHNNNIPMKIEDIADAINLESLYIKKDGTRIDARHVAWRTAGDVVKGNPPQFDVLIRLRQES